MTEENRRGLVVLGVLGMVGAFIVFIQETPPAPPPATKRYEPIDAVAISRAYEENEVAADLRFKGRHWLVSGDIKSIGKDITGRPYLILRPNVQCSLPDSSAQQVALFTKGNTASLYCESSGKLIHPLLNCTLN